MKVEKVVCAICRSKNMFEKTMDELPFDDELYPLLCPNPADVLTKSNDLQVCPACGYVARYLREDLGGIKKGMLKSEKYLAPFGEKCKEEKVIRNYQAGIIYSHGRCRRTAAEHFIRAGVIAVTDEVKVHCFRKAWLCLKEYLYMNHVSSNFECYLAYLNMMRLLRMFDAVTISVEEHAYEFGDLEKTLLMKIYRLSEEADSNYFTYTEMLSK